MKIFCMIWVALIIAYLIAAYWWAGRAEKRFNEQLKKCMAGLEKTAGQHKKALLELYQHADKACGVRENMGRRLRDVENWIARSEVKDESGWNDAELLIPGKPGDYWVTVDEDGIRTVKVATFIGDWIVGAAEIVEGWKPIEKEPDPYVRKEEKG